MATFAPGQGSGAGISGYSAQTPGNYVDVFGFDNAPQSTDLPQIYEREVTIYGNRTLMGFLRMIGSEMPTNSQQIRWAEQRRLHVFYNRVRRVGANTSTFDIYASDAAVTVGDDVIAAHAVREQDKVLLGRTDGVGSAILCIVTDVTAAGRVTLNAYTGADDAQFDGLQAVNTTVVQDLSILVVGSEFGKASDSRDRIIQPEYDTYTNSTVIMRDTYAVNGTDANQIGWVEVADENGVQGKYWYVKGKSETMTRWNDYLETAILEDRKPATGSTVTAGKQATNTTVAQTGTARAQLTSGSEGLFEAIENRGNVATGGFASSNGPGTIAGTNFLSDLDRIVDVLDAEGNIEENLFYLGRDQSLNFDDGMAAQNNNGANNTAWGLFNNSEKMGLSFGFSSVRRGSYDFYKKDWKYLNQVDGRGSFGGVSGVSVPMGTKSVYDQYGANLSMPFATINYLAAPNHSRQNMSWAHGGLAPTPTSGVDELRLEFLTERCLCLKGANNFILFR